MELRRGDGREIGHGRLVRPTVGQFRSSHVECSVPQFRLPSRPLADREHQGQAPCLAVFVRPITSLPARRGEEQHRNRNTHTLRRAARTTQPSAGDVPTSEVDVPARTASPLQPLNESYPTSLRAYP